MSTRKYGASSFKRPMTEEKEMSEVERFEIEVTDSNQYRHVKVPFGGSYVNYRDYAALKAECDALAAKLSRYSMSAGEADQRLCESRAVRVALGFGADAEDVAPADLTDKINALALENKVLDSAIGAIADAYETGLKDLLAQEIDTAVNTTTPATDAYANQLRAEGVEMVRNHPAISLCNLTHVCDEIAANLRAGEPS